ncbi:MAG: DUF4437 domain-containing protein [Pseudomonadota bacterium]
MNTVKPLLSSLFLSVIIFWASAQAISKDTDKKQKAVPTYKVIPKSEIKWQQLNPLRGDKSPQAGTLWGDRIGPGPAGFILKPIDGFRSPPHIHNIAYRGVVISGLLHNDDPSAEDMWMPTGSFWTQPAGGIHITAAKGNNTLAYIEVEDGFGVLPAKDAFEDKEKPVNVDISNITWLDSSELSRISLSTEIDPENGPKVAFLWGKQDEEQLNGTLIKLPVGFSGEVHTSDALFRAVTIQGQLKHSALDKNNFKVLEPGSYFGSRGKAEHQVMCKEDIECIIYVRTKGKFDIRAS